MVNKVILIGRIGTDIQTKDVNGAKVAQFSLATSERYKDKEGNKQEHTEWHNIVMWRNLADIVEKYCHKGDAIYVEGSIRTRSWENDRGEKRYATDIVANNMQMLGSKKDNTPQQKDNDWAGSGDDDLPFN